MQLHLIDGTYELYRAHFGAPSRSSPEGMEVGGTYAITAATLAVLVSPEVTHVAAAFDTVIESFRNEMYEGYKTGAGIEPELYAQFPLAEEAMRAIGVTVWPMHDHETDDALATAADRWVDEVDRVVVHSPDKDMAQLYGNRKVVGYDRRKRAFIDRAAVVEKFGVEPESIPDYLALVGDSADGYPGAAGWGAKSSATLLARYGRFEEIPTDAGDWDVSVRGAERLAASLAESRSDVALFKELATLRRDVPLEETLEDLRWRGAPREEFLGFCEKYGFDGLRERPQRWAA